MSGNSVKWIPLGGMDLSAANLAPAEKLRKFGFSLVSCEFGSEKLTKAGICIYDVLAEKENPNILLITSRRVLYGWYRILMTGIGADFKVVSGAANEIVFFSQDSSNMYLVPADALNGANALSSKIPQDFVWDLIIIDDEQNTGVPDYAFWKEQLRNKTERLLLISQFPAKDDEDKAALSGLVKQLLADEEQASCADGLDLTAAGMPLSYDGPVLRVNDKRVYTGEIKRNVSFVDYGFDQAFISGLRRRIEIRSGLPNYKYGGNIFEEYDVEEYKALYQKQTYTPSDVSELRSADKKLDALLKLTDEVMAQENCRAVIYCCDKNTLEYLKKALNAMYPGSGNVKAARGELVSNRDILRKLNVDDRTTYPKLLLATDEIGAVGDGLDRVTHVINYELPATPLLLERRMTRHGSKNESSRSFIIFRDSNRLFDSRMLDKVLYGGLADAFCGDSPARNILLDTDIKAESLNNLISDLRYTESYSSEVDNCYDLIKKFKCEYELLGAGKIANAKQLADYSGKLLAKICGFFGVDKNASQEDIAAAVAPLAGLCSVNDGVLIAVSGGELSAIADSLDADPAAQPFGEEAIAGVEEAHKRIEELHSGSNYHLMIKNDIQSLNDCIQYPVLYGVWRYRVREQDSVRSFRDFMTIYNDGI
ncbi:MAG: hypothetical protein ACI4WS_06585 [Oscillospiraceae bacterium]